MSNPNVKSAGQNKASAGRSAPAFSPRLLPPIVVTGLFLLGIFLLPYHIPGPGPADSQSWEFGFNNTVAQGLIALMLLSLFAWQFLLGRQRPESDPVMRIFDAEEERVPPGPLLYTMGSLQLFACAVLLIWFAILPNSHYGELTYFIQRVEACVLGRAPYVDFGFDYGPALLALPVGIYHLFHAAVSVENAYIASLLVHFVIGFGILAYLLSQLHARGRWVIMAMMGFQMINLTLGLQYTPVRFTIAVASLFVVRQIHRTAYSSPARRLWLLALTGFLLPLISFSISPEMGLALTISLCVYFLWFLLGPERRLALLVLAVFLGLAVTAVFFPRPYFNAMLSFGKGGGNFPIFPTIHILGFLAAALWIFPRLGVIALRDRSGTGPFCAGLAFLCGMFILPATGRCDPGHVWSNSVALFVIALAAVSWLPKKWWYTLWAIYFLIFPVTNEFAAWDNYAGPIQGALAMRAQLAGVSYDADNFAHLAPGSPRPPIHYSKLLPMEGLDGLPPVKMGLPLGDNEVLERYLVLHGRFIPSYYMAPYDDIFGDADMKREEGYLHKMEYIYVPTYYLGYLQPMNLNAVAIAQAKADSKWLSGLLLFPVDLPSAHPIYLPDAELMRHIASEYSLVQQYQSGVLLRRRAP